MGDALDGIKLLSVDDTVNKIEKGRRECETAGEHLKPYYYSSSIEYHTYIVDGLCQNCLATLQRGLTREEHDRINERDKLFKMPVTSRYTHIN